MEDKELVFDYEHHMLYTKQCREEILNKIFLHYSDEPSEKNFKKKACNFTLETSEIIMGWFNIYGLIIIAVIMIPNIVFAIKNKNGFENLQNNKITEILEQIGRFSCFVLMIFNIPYTYIGFWFDNALAVYIIVCTVLVTAYCLVWVIFFRKNCLFRAVALSVIPSVLFLFCAVMLLNVPLIIMSLIFAPCHILISVKNADLKLK